jgi:hypothetical protein
LCQFHLNLLFFFGLFSWLNVFSICRFKSSDISSITSAGEDYRWF